MGKKGHMPPGVPPGPILLTVLYPGSDGYVAATDCVNVNDTYCIAFDHAGVLASITPGYFKDASGNDLQDGLFARNAPYGPYYPQKTGQVTLLFVDAETLLGYTEILSITNNCALGTDTCP